MGKLPYMYTDSEDTETTSSSTENMKKNKKKKLSILKYTAGTVKKKKCKKHSSRSEPDETEYTSKSRSNQKIKSKLHGILKHDKESSDDDEDLESPPPRSWDRCLVGRVPRPAGARPGRGGGVALVVRKNTCLQGFTSTIEAQNSSSSTKRSRSMTKKLGRKRSY